MPGLMQNIMMSYRRNKRQREYQDYLRQQQQEKMLNRALSYMPEDTEGDVLYDLLRPMLGDDLARVVGEGRARKLGKEQEAEQTKRDQENTKRQASVFSTVRDAINAASTPDSEVMLGDYPDIDLLTRGQQDALRGKAGLRDTDLTSQADYRKKRQAKMFEEELEPMPDIESSSDQMRESRQYLELAKRYFPKDEEAQREFAFETQRRKASPATADILFEQSKLKQEQETGPQITADARYLLKKFGRDETAVMEFIQQSIDNGTIQPEEKDALLVEYERLLRDGR